jgi:hypothetical protein
MFDHRSLKQSHAPGTDQVLDGGDIRERFFTAYLLRNGGVAPSRPRITVYSSQDELLYEGDAAAWLNLESRISEEDTAEPVFLNITDAWFSDDNDL